MNRREKHDRRVRHRRERAAHQRAAAASDASREYAFTEKGVLSIFFGMLDTEHTSDEERRGHRTGAARILARWVAQVYAEEVEGRPAGPPLPAPQRPTIQTFTTIALARELEGASWAGCFTDEDVHRAAVLLLRCTGAAALNDAIDRGWAVLVKTFGVSEEDEELAADAPA